MENCNDGIVTSVPSPKNKICPKMSGKWSYLIAGVCVLLLVVSLYFFYRHVSSVNKRFQSLEDLLSKVIDKTNQLQHVIQNGYAVPQQRMEQSSPSQHVAVAPPPPINLDKELAEELKELDSSSSSTTPTTTAEKEGRVDDDLKD